MGKIKLIKILSLCFLIPPILISSIIFCAYPEGVKVLSHYVFGKGKDYEISSSYFPKSPVINKKLNTMHIGQTKIVTFKQNEDWRLSYALNPFRLTKTGDGFKIYQYIEFDRTGEVYTEFNLFGFRIKIIDHWVNYLGTKPYMLTYTHNN